MTSSREARFAAEAAGGEAVVWVEKYESGG